MPKNANKINSKPEGNSKLESKITSKITSKLNVNDNETAKDKKGNSAKNKRTKLN